MTSLSDVTWEDILWQILWQMLPDILLGIKLSTLQKVLFLKSTKGFWGFL